MQVSNGAVRVYSGEGEVACSSRVRTWEALACAMAGAPTLAVVSVRLLSVVDFPDDGLPTRPMSGSRGIARFATANIM